MVKRGLVWLARGVARLLQLLMLPVRRHPRRRPVTVLAYRGYGNRRELHVTGRVVEDTGGPSTRAAGSLWTELARMYRALASRPVPCAEVLLRHDGCARRVQADENGFFVARLDCEPLPAERDDIWEPVEIALVRPAGAEPVRPEAPDAAPGHASEHVSGDAPANAPMDPAPVLAPVLVPTARARMVIISDIDDTVMVTGVANKLLMLWRLFAKPAASRVPFAGVAAFYRALHAGVAGQEQNPMLYVSRGPWTIYPELDKFFALHCIPVGPVLHLRDWGVSFRHPLPRRQEGHKLDLIEQMLAVYPDLPFLMIGDSGQHDPEVYAEVARNHPRRVQAVYIRDVTRTARRTEQIGELARELRRADADLVLTDSTLEMARHAAARGWIPRTAIDEIAAEIGREGTPVTEAHRPVHG